MVFNWELIATVVAAAGIGTAITNWLGQSRDRRTVRADFLRVIRELESQKQAPYDAAALREAVTTANALALTARVPRGLYVEYMAALRGGAYASNEAFTVGIFHPTTGKQLAGPGTGAIPVVLAHYQERTGLALVAVVWNPLLGRLRYPFAARRLRTWLEKQEDEATKNIVRDFRRVASVR